MSDSRTPRVAVSYANDSPEHKAAVGRFAAFLRGAVGLDTRLDQCDDNKLRDWASWADEQLDEADVILVVASPAYQRRDDGRATPEDERQPHHDGRDSRCDGQESCNQAAIPRNSTAKNLRETAGRILPVLLPGRSVEDIPRFLNACSTTWFRIEEFTRAGVADLVAAITGRSQFPGPERGSSRGEAPDEPVRLAGGLRWSACSSGVRAGSARIGGELFEDSIVVRPASPTATIGFVTMDLGGRYERLTAVAGVLEDATEPFQVGRFRVVVDGTPRWESQALLDKPATVDVDVAGATTLRLEMCRPCTTSAPLNSPLGSSLRSGWRVSGRLPELAWGNPTLFR